MLEQWVAQFSNEYMHVHGENTDQTRGTLINTQRSNVRSCAMHTAEWVSVDECGCQR